MWRPLPRLFLHEQRAFLARDRRGWDEHLFRIREFLGQGLAEADPERPLLILGAGSGLELPWRRAPQGSVGWDADPLSRLRTFLRHGRWAPWVFGDLTGQFDPLRRAALRAVRESWSGRRRGLDVARRRLTALLPSLPADPAPLQGWVRRHQPGTILAANFMGQLGPMAQRILEAAFSPEDPWESDPERVDDLAVALEAWTARQVRSLLECLAASGAQLWLVHDRAVLGGERPVVLGSFAAQWETQLRGDGPLEAWDPLGGVDVLEALPGRSMTRAERWLWPVGPGQLHLVEALAFATPGSGGRGSDS